MDEVQAPEQQRLGDGQMPGRLDRVNFGAFLLPLLWTLIYGIWPWFFALVGVFVVNAGLGFATQPLVGDSVPLSVARSVVTISLAFGVAAVFSLRANRLVWEKERRRVAWQSDQSVPRLADPVSKFERTQRLWVIWGVVFFVWVSVWPLFSSVFRTPVSLATTALAAAAELVVLAGLYLHDRKLDQRTVQS